MYYLLKSYIKYNESALSQKKAAEDARIKYLNSLEKYKRDIHNILNEDTTTRKNFTNKFINELELHRTIFHIGSFSSEWDSFMPGDNYTLPSPGDRCAIVSNLLNAIGGARGVFSCEEIKKNPSYRNIYRLWYKKK